MRLGLIESLFAVGLCVSCGGSGGSSGNTPSHMAPASINCPATDGRIGTVQLQYEAAFAQLPAIVSLLGLHQAPNDSSTFYAVSQAGRVLRFANRADASVLTPVLDIHTLVTFGGESGLLGIAFHPQFASNGFLYVDYTGGSPLTSTIARYTLRDDGTFDPASAKTVLTQSQPFSNHNGGQIAFGPDGFLYIALGDGGSGGDPNKHGQNTNTLLGKILRIDVDRGANYAIPADNPFASGGGLPEIYAYGLRNPWRFSFDRQSGELWAGDVGQNAYEEIDLITRGGNYGWRVMEGSHCFGSSSCDQAGLTLPLHEYSHDLGCSVTGGFVYRGGAIGALRGRYLFSDFCSATVWSLQRGAANEVMDHGALDGNISSFAEDLAGELYLLNLSGGVGLGIYRIIPKAENGAADTVRTPLSQAGCGHAGDSTQ